MEFEQIIKLIQTVSDSSLTDFKFEEGNLSLRLQKKNNNIVTVTSESSNIDKPILRQEDLELFSLSNKSLSNENDKIVSAANPDSVVKSPLVGTFYSAKAEDAPPFVKVGDTVKKGQVLGIIEAMKLMNEIDCEFDGVITAVLVQNEQLVEYGQPLFRIQTAK